LGEVLAYRDQLTGEIVARTQQKRLYSSPALLGRAEASLASLRREKRELEREIARMLKESETLGGTAELVLSVFGVGPVVAASLLAFLPELGQLDEKEIASLAGLAPMAHDSGQRHIAEGRSKVRRVLYMAVVAGLRSNAELRKVYDRLIKAGKPGKVAMVAVMRKLLVWLNAMVRDGLPWEPDAQKRGRRQHEAATQDTAAPAADRPQAAAA
jgi:transposase